ncbi:HAD family hydrolase [Allofustis seminis]|uniref:HAD family hydrolase n=1 Tax=Allofustis seminis TaxID=166939 RepID=UPI0003745E4B|nr:HAD family phosphatase [Allofustis seminis]
MTTIQGVIFDMDGLMFDTEVVYYSINRRVAESLGFEFTKDFYRQFIGSDSRHYVEGVHQLVQDDELADRFLKEADRQLYDAFMEGDIDYQVGLIELLEQLKTWNIPAVVASSTDRQMVDHLLKKLNVAQYFVGVVGGDEVHYAKPDPAIFNKAASLLDIPKEHLVVLEDSLNGIRAAHSANIRVIMVPDLVIPGGEAEEKTTAIVSDLHAVIDYIAAENGK